MVELTLCSTRCTKSRLDACALIHMSISGIYKSEALVQATTYPNIKDMDKYNKCCSGDVMMYARPPP